jgi:hypothetical protein
MGKIKRVIDERGNPMLSGLSAWQIADTLHNAGAWEQRFAAYKSEPLGRILIWMYNINTKECQYIIIQSDPQSLRELNRLVPQMAITTEGSEFARLITTYWPRDKHVHRVKALVEFDGCGKGEGSLEH